MKRRKSFIYRRRPGRTGIETKECLHSVVSTAVLLCVNVPDMMLKITV